MGNTDYRAVEAFEHLTDYRTGKRGKIPCRFIQYQYIAAVQTHFQEQKLCFLPAGKLPDTMGHFICRIPHAAQIGADHGLLRLITLSGKKFHGILIHI